MPTVLATVLASLFLVPYTALVAIGVSASTAGFIASVGVQLIGLSLLGALARKLFPVPDLTQTATANAITVRGTLEHQRIVYGEVMLSGPLWYMNSAGTHNQSLYHAVIVAGHEITDITDMKLDDQVIDGAGGAIDWSGTGSVDSGWLAGNTALATTTYFQKKLGGDNQSASNFLAAGDGIGGAFSEINSQHQGRNIAYFVVRNDYFDGQTDVWSGGAPRNFRGLVQGKKVYNPNSDSTQAWGTGPHRLVSPSSWEYSNNPALCWADYMIDSSLGFGEDSARINYAYVASAAAICSDSVSTPNSATTQRFTCNGALSTGTSHRGNLVSILSAGNMTMALIQGEWKLRGWEFETPTLSFSDDDLRGDMQIQLSTEEEQRYNTVRGSYLDKGRGWTAQQFPSFTAAEYVARDNGETLFKDIQLPMTTDTYMAQRLAAGILEQSDLQATVIYPSNFKTLPVEIGGTIMLTNDKMSWVDKDFRVTNYKLNDMNGIDLVLQEDTSAAYTPVATDEYTVLTNGVYTTADPGVPAPSSLWVNGRVDGIQVNVTLPPARLFETITIFTSPTSAFTDATSLASIADDTFFHKLDNPRTQYYWAQAVNFAGELSVKVPNSDYSNVFDVAALDGTLTDPSFDKSPELSDFWDRLPNSLSSGTIILAGQGERGTNALEIDHRVNQDGRGARTKNKVPIQSSRIAMQVRYQVNCWSGVDTPTSLFRLAAWGYRPTPVSSSKYVTSQNSYTTTNADGQDFYFNADTDNSGSWATLVATLDFTNMVNSGATHFSPYMTVTYSDSTVQDNFDAQLNISRIGFHWL